MQKNPGPTVLEDDNKGSETARDTTKITWSKIYRPHLLLPQFSLWPLPRDIEAECWTINYYWPDIFKN